MKNKSPAIAKVDIPKVKYTKPEILGIDFFNEIDIWSQMEFHYREKIKKLSKNKSSDQIFKNPHSIVYALREQID